MVIFNWHHWGILIGIIQLLALLALPALLAEGHHWGFFAKEYRQRKLALFAGRRQQQLLALLAEGHYQGVFAAG